MNDKQDLTEEITSVAYTIYVQKGFSGSDMENWLEAERIVLERHAGQKPSEKVPKVPIPRTKKRTVRR